MEKFNSSRQRFPALTRSRRHAVTSKEGENRLAPTKLYSYLGMGSIPGPQMKRRPEKGGKLNTSHTGSVAASRAAVGQFLSISREAQSSHP